MNRVAICLLALAGVLQSCSSKTCTLMGCSNDITVHVRDAAGQPVASFSAVVTVDGTELSVDCSAGPDDARQLIEQNHVSVACDGTLPELWISNVVERGYDIAISLASTSGNYQGGLNLNVTRIEDFNGEGCGTCSYADAVVRLE